MSKVKVLPPEIVSKIAAGEVVDRPGSVVKELMENALDAGATRIEVILKDGGKTLIQVKDNGLGIAPEDLKQLFKRHATSKISKVSDLDALSSLGFRGEALYSIGAVSEVNIRSLVKGAKEAWQMNVKGGERFAPEPVALAEHGTEIRIEEIFFNVPARKKFLKSNSAELDYVVQNFLPYTLRLPEIHFVLINNDKTIYDVLPVASLSARAAKCLNLNPHYIIEEKFVSIEGPSVQLVLGDINIQRSRRDMQYIFVNGRPVSHKNFSFQINDIFRLIMPQGVHPFFIAFVEFDPQDVDVHIHPQKREVRIKSESSFMGFLRHSVEVLLMTKGEAKQVEVEGVLSFDDSPGSEGIASHEMVFGKRECSDRPILFSDHAPRQNIVGANPGVRPMKGSKHGLSSTNEMGNLLSPDMFQPRAETLQDRLQSARFIGTFSKKYHLFEQGDGLFALDQHAAQERILFERFLNQVNAGKVEVQPLLVPITIKLSQAEMLRWDSSCENLKEFGLETTQLGDEAVAINAHPALLRNPETVFHALLADERVDFANHDAVASRACRASVMTGDVMADLEAKSQLKELLACKDPMTCPHGRPTFIEMKMSFLDRQFLRT